MSPEQTLTVPATETLKRHFRMRDVFTLAFVFISPIVALYVIFDLVLQTAGPAAWWVFPIGLAFQMLVAISLAMLVSRFPFQGGGYQWARRLVGTNYGWLTGWFYMWAFTIFMSSTAYALSSFIPALLGIEPFSMWQQIWVSAGVLAVITILNLLGPAVLNVLALASLVAEVIGSIGLSIVLLMFHRQNDIGVIFTTGGVSNDNYFLGAFLLAVGFVGFGLAGFENVCSMAEEVERPRQNLPKAMIGALFAIGVVVMFSALALILATPDFGAIISGAIADPAANTIRFAFGDDIARLFFLLVIIGFAASMMTAQSSISRVIWAYARDNVFPASGFFSQLSGKRRTPNRVIVLVGAVAIAITLLAASERIFATLVSIATTCLFITMGLVVVALLTRLLVRKWTPGPFTLGALSLPVVAIASCWIVFEIANLVWPRDSAGQPWYVTWAVFIGIAAIALTGFLVWRTLRDRIKAAEHILNAEVATSTVSVVGELAED